MGAADADAVFGTDAEHLAKIRILPRGLLRISDLQKCFHVVAT